MIVFRILTWHVSSLWFVFLQTEEWKWSSKDGRRIYQQWKKLFKDRVVPGYPSTLSPEELAAKRKDLPSSIRVVAIGGTKEQPKYFEQQAEELGKHEDPIVLMKMDRLKKLFPTLEFSHIQNKTKTAGSRWRSS